MHQTGAGPHPEGMCVCAKEEHIGFCYVLKEIKVELLEQPCSVKDRRQKTGRERCKVLSELLDFLLL